MRQQMKGLAAVFWGSCVLWAACEGEPDDTPPPQADSVAASDSGNTDTNSTGDTSDGPGVDTAQPPGPPCGGPCADGSRCIEDRCVPNFCPPPGPYGVHPGDYLTDVVVKDCDGNDVHIHELCGAPAGFFNLLAGW